MANGLVEKIYSLINKSNETTGKTDTDLTRCIKSLSEGYGLQSNINGIIREYEVNAGANVNAGDFVEFVNKCGKGEFHTAAINYLTACKLDNSRVLVAYSDEANGSYGTASVLTIADGSISRGPECVFNTKYTYHISVCALTDSKAIIAYYTYNNNELGYVKTLSIDGSNIYTNGGADFAESSVTGTAVVALNDSKAFLIYGYYASGAYEYRSAARILTINGTSIPLGNTKIISSSECTFFSACALNESKVIFSYNYYNKSSSKHLLTLIAASIDGDTFSIKSYSMEAGEGSIHHSSVCALTNSKAIIAYSDFSNSACGSARTITIAGEGVSLGDPIIFRSSGTSWMSIAPLSESKVLVSYYGSAKVLTINGTAITAGNPFVFNPTETDGTRGTYKTVIAFSDNSALVVFTDGSDIRGIGAYASLSIDDSTITENEASGTFVQPAKSNLHNVGVAKTAGAEGESVEVYCAV